MPNELTQQYTTHLNSIIRMYDDAYQDEGHHIPERVAYGILARARGAIEKISGGRSSYTQQMLSILDKDWHPSYQAELIIGIATALKSDLQDGYLASLSELVHGEIFSSYLQMAEYLLAEGFKDAAAVIAGSTLEAHLRQLCVKHGIDTEHRGADGSDRPKKASQLNQDLAKIAYSQFDQKQVTAWLDLRNSAAHGKYGDYTQKSVEQFVEWLRDFTDRNPA